MNVLKQCMHSLEDSLKRFNTIQYLMAVNNYVTHFQAYNNIVWIVLNGYVIGNHTNFRNGKFMTQLTKYINGSDWPKSIQKVMKYTHGPFRILIMGAVSAKVKLNAQQVWELNDKIGENL